MRILVVWLLLVAPAYAVRIADYPQTNWADKFDAALDDAVKKKEPLEFPSGWMRVDRTLCFAKRSPKEYADELKLWESVGRRGNGPKPLSHRDCLRGITIRGNGCKVVYEGEPGHAIFDCPATYYCRFENFDLYTTVDNVVGVHVRAAWEFDTNGAHGLTFDQVNGEGLRTLGYTGGPMGPDLRGHLWSNCMALRCDTPWVFEGANVTSCVLQNCGATIYRDYAVVSKGHTTRYFDAGEVKDLWGLSWPLEKYGASPKFMGRTRPNPQNGRIEAKGGGAKVDVFKFDAVCSSDQSEKTFAFLSDRGNIDAQQVRCEGANNGIYHSRGPVRKRYGKDAARFACHIERASCISKGVNVRIDGGFPVDFEQCKTPGKWEIDARADVTIDGFQTQGKRLVVK